MGNIFHVYASHGLSNYVELDLPASDHEMMDLAERLRLEPGQLPYVEILRYREEYDYLEKCVCELPDIYQINELARKLDTFSAVQDMAVFEGLVGKEIRQNDLPVPITRLIDFAYSTGDCPVAEDVVNDHQLGKFLVENDFIKEANGLPGPALALLDYGKIGKERREAEGGVYTGFGYVELHSEVCHVSETMDFQLKKPSYTVLLNLARIVPGQTLQEEDMVRLRLPAPEQQIQEALESLGQHDWSSAVASIWDCAVPSMSRSRLFIREEIPQVLDFAKCLQELEAQGKLPQYKAILAAMDCEEIGQAISLAGTVDDYIFDPRTSSPEDVAMGELCVMIGQECAADFSKYVDLNAFGRSLLERDHAVITGYGLIERQDGQPVQGMEQKAEGMVMA